MFAGGEAASFENTRGEAASHEPAVQPGSPSWLVGEARIFLPFKRSSRCEMSEPNGFE